VASSAAAPDAVEWVINLASFTTVEQVQGEVQKLQGAGYPAVSEPREVGGIMRYRLQLHGYPTVEAARAVADEVAAKFGYRDYYLFKTP
jgi:cell division septation protein DedD